MNDNEETEETEVLNDHDQFVKDMEAAGFETYEYHGRYFWKGPAITCLHEQLQEVIRATSVKVQWDHMGLNSYVIYPKKYQGE